MERIYESLDFNIKSGGFKKAAAIILIKNMMMQASIFDVQQGTSTKLPRGPSGWIARKIMQVKNFIEVSFVLLPNIPFIIFHHVTNRGRLAAMVECIPVVRRITNMAPLGLTTRIHSLRAFIGLLVCSRVREARISITAIFDQAREKALDKRHLEVEANWTLPLRGRWERVEARN